MLENGHELMLWETSESLNGKRKSKTVKSIAENCVESRLFCFCFVPRLF